jgi:hypothetical protein
MLERVNAETTPYLNVLLQIPQLIRLALSQYEYIAWLNSSIACGQGEVGPDVK